MTKTSSSDRMRTRGFAVTLTLNLTVNLTLLAPVLAGLSACGGDEQGAVEATEAALTLPPAGTVLDQCFAKPADATGIRGSFATLHAPTNYGTTGCPKAYVFDATPPPTTTGVDYTELQWSDMWARNEVQCEGGTLRLVLMSKAPGDAFARTEGTFDVPLQWDGASCAYTKIRVVHSQPLTDAMSEGWSVVTFREGVGTWLSIDEIPIRNFNGRTLRFVASALTPAGSTQPMKLFLKAL